MYTCSPSRGLRVVCETENPKTLGNSFSSWLTMVDLPTPEGPQMTSGLMGALNGAIFVWSEVKMPAEKDVATKR